MTLNSEDTEDFETGESNPDYQLFPFRSEDLFIVEELKERFRDLLKKPNLSPTRVRQIGTVLFALERLPRSTPGVFVVIGPHYSFNNETSYCDLCISESEFSLSRGGSIYDPAVGGDNYSSTVFEIETSGYRDGSGEDPDVFEWFNMFDELLSLGGKLYVEYLGEDELVDWSQEGSKEFWNELDEHE